MDPSDLLYIALFLFWLFSQIATATKKIKNGSTTAISSSATPLSPHSRTLNPKFLTLFEPSIY